jgi:hypothetical protein
MRKIASFFFIGTMLALLIGCGTTQGNGISGISDSGSPEVSLSITDDPPNGVQVLFFQAGITQAYLTSTSGATVSLLNNNTPIQVDVTQLQAISAFLSTANVSAATYNSLTVVFANFQLVIFNDSDSSIASTCAIGSVCQLTPTLDGSGTVTFSSTPFPVTIGQNSQLGFLLDFHLNNVIQSDLSVNLGASNGVTVSELPSQHPQFGFLVGTVANVSPSNSDFSLITPDGRTFTVDVSGSTTFDDFPSSDCSTGSIACLVSGQVVQVQVASIEPKRVLAASSITFLQAAGQQMVEGNIIGLSTSGGTTTMTLVLHRTPFNSGNLPLGGEAQVAISSSATFTADLNGFTLPAGLAFTGASDLVDGQEVSVQVAAGSLTTSSGSGGSGMWGHPPSVSFTTDSVELEPSQVTGNITGVDSSTSSFTLSIQPSMFFGHWSSGASTSSTINVDTTSQTSYFNLNPDSFSGLASNNMVSAQGWLFPPASGASSPTMAAENVVGRPFGFF